MILQLWAITTAGGCLRGSGGQAGGLLEAERAARALKKKEADRVRRELHEAVSAAAAAAAELAAEHKKVLCPPSLRL